VGHGGANIGTGAYMVYFPDYGVSIAVMVNRVFSGCESRIVRDLARIAALSLQPGRYYADVLRGPLGFVAGLWVLAGLGAAVCGVRRDKPINLLVFGGLALAAGWISIGRWTPLDFVLFPVGGLAAALGLVLLVRRLLRRPAAPR